MIKQVDEIPKTLRDKRESYRSMIRADIKEAIDKGIDKFEFEGDYNYKYLAQYAKEEADVITRRIISPIRNEIRERLGVRNFSLYDFNAKGQYIKIVSCKGEDRQHVYCEICSDFLKEYSAIAEAEAEAVLKKQQERDNERQST